MSHKSMYLMVALDQNLGYEKDNVHPWSLPEDFQHFKKTTIQVSDSKKQNAVVMCMDIWGHLTVQPLPQRKNVLIASTNPGIPEVDVYPTLNETIAHLQTDDSVEIIWIIGGFNLFKEALEHPSLDRIYLTEVQATFECDTYFPDFKNTFKLAENPDELFPTVPSETQMQNGLEFCYKIYVRK